MRINMKPALAGCLALVLLIAIKPIYGSIAVPAETAELPQPGINLQPAEIVQIVIDALANNDHPYPDAGIETTFNFASPSNKANTGPLQRFTMMVKGPVFGKMINHRKSQFSEVVVQGDHAYQVVNITSLDNQVLHFAFRLGLQREGQYQGMWLTEAVWPLHSPEGKVYDI